MATSKANLLGKRKPEDGLAGPTLKKHKEVSEEKETTKEHVEETVEGDLETEPVLKKPKEKETRKEQIKGRVELLEAKSDEANSISVKGLNATSYFSEEAAVSKKTLFVCRLPLHTKISDIIDFFKDVGLVVRVQLQLYRKYEYSGQCFVEFASANQAKKALEKKKGECLHNRKIGLGVANNGLPRRYCIDHKIWYEQDFLPIKEDETPPNIAKAVDTVRSKTLFIANLSPQTTKISHITNFFDVAKVVSVRLIVNDKGKHVGCGFVEFASSYEAKKALEYKNDEYLDDHKIFLMKGGVDETPDFAEAVATVRNKTLFVARLSPRTQISDIIHFFKDVGEVVHVRLIVDSSTRHVTFGFVEFASANEAAKALEKKNGEYLDDSEIFLDVVKAAPHPVQSKHCIDHKVWYEDYPQRESLMTAVEGVDETPDIVEKKTVFVAPIAMRKDSPYYISNIINWFKSVGKVVSVRIIGDDKGRSCGFVEFASANEAEKAVQEKNGSASCVTLAETDPYPFRPKYNLPDIAEKLWYEDKLRGEGFGLPKPKLVKQAATFCGKKITFEDYHSSDSTWFY